MWIIDTFSFFKEQNDGITNLLIYFSSFVLRERNINQSSIYFTSGFGMHLTIYNYPNNNITTGLRPKSESRNKLQFSNSVDSEYNSCFSITSVFKVLYTDCHLTTSIKKTYERHLKTIFIILARKQWNFAPFKMN